MQESLYGVQNLVGIDSAVTDLRMREKTRFVRIF